MKANGRLLITSKIAVGLMIGIWLATGTGCPPPPVPDGNVNDNTGDNVNDNTGANAALEPLFLASVSSEVQRAPALREVIEDTCAKCHLPMAYTQADTDGTSTLMFDDGLLNPGDPLHDEAIEGVSCALCHQITDAFLDDPEAGFDGEYTVDTTTAQPDRPTYGPFPQPQQADVMQAASGFLPVYSPHIEEAGLCGRCT